MIRHQNQNHHYSITSRAQNESIVHFSILLKQNQLVVPRSKKKLRYASRQTYVSHERSKKILFQDKRQVDDTISRVWLS